MQKDFAPKVIPKLISFANKKSNSILLPYKTLIFFSVHEIVIYIFKKPEKIFTFSEPIFDNALKEDHDYCG